MTRAGFSVVLIQAIFNLPNIFPTKVWATFLVFSLVGFLVDVLFVSSFCFWLWLLVIFTGNEIICW